MNLPIEPMQAHVCRTGAQVKSFFYGFWIGIPESAQRCASAMNSRARLRAVGQRIVRRALPIQVESTQRLIQAEPIGQPQQATHWADISWSRRETAAPCPPLAAFPDQRIVAAPGVTSRFARRSCGWCVTTSGSGGAASASFGVMPVKVLQKGEMVETCGRARQLSPPELEIVGLEIDDADGNHLRCLTRRRFTLPAVSSTSTNSMRLYLLIAASDPGGRDWQATTGQAPMRRSRGAAAADA